MKKHWIVVLSALGFLLLASCTGKNLKTYNNVDEMVADAKKTVTFINAEELKKTMDSGKKFYLIDCRETAEFDSSCIKGAVNVPRGVIENEISNNAPKKKLTLLVYCNNGNKSILAATVLPKLKYTNVKVIEGGFDAIKTKFPDIIEMHPVRGGAKVKVPAKSSGGCGG